MHTSPVSPHIERLVDHLRSDSSADITIGDVAGVTEVLLSTMQRYFNSLDLSIYDEFRNLTDHIKKAREEIAQVRPNDLKQEKIPRAGAELEAIVQATEAATGTIMDAAEEIMSADSSDPEAYQQAVNDACMRIFEACSFQDITGQRITKVVSTLTFIEDRLNTLQVAWGPQIEDKEQSDSDIEEDDSALLNGPALAGEGIEQDDIDRLMSSADEADEADVDTGDQNESPSLEAEDSNAADDDVDEIDEAAEVQAADVDDDSDDYDADARTTVAPVVKREKSAEVAAKVASGGEVSQADIDAMFD